VQPSALTKSVRKIKDFPRHTCRHPVEESVLSTLSYATRRALLAAGAGLALPLAALAAAQPGLKKVRIAVGTNVLNLTYPWLTLPLIKGWWRQEGYDVEVLPVGASLQALQQMVAGNVDFAQLNSSVVIQANVVNGIPVRAVMNNGVLDWSLAVPKDSAIGSPRDLKGKAIGVFSLATGGIAFMKSYLREFGIDPNRDVQIIPVGLGAPAVDALRSDRVQALMYWGSALASFENAGLKLRYFQGDDWALMPDFTFATLQKTIDADPAMVEAIARGAAKACVFVTANPDCQRRLHWAAYPSSKPTGADEATLIARDMNNLRMQLVAMQGAFEMNGGKLWGRATPQAYGRIQAFMEKTGMIPRSLDPATYMPTIPGFFEKINNFDYAEIQQQARVCGA
jgi:NitT/TauT family transport system substrate-binding protein